MLLDARIVIIPVPDLGCAREWYATVLQIRPAHATPDAVRFNGGNYEVQLVRGKRPHRHTIATAPVYWRVANLERALQRMYHAGAKPHSPVKAAPDIGLRASVTDPFGNVLGLVEEQNVMLA